MKKVTHDDVMLWLDAQMDEVLQPLMADVYSWHPIWSQFPEGNGGARRLHVEPDGTLSLNSDRPLSDQWHVKFPIWKATEKRWEAPILNGRDHYVLRMGKIEGYADMLVTVSQKSAYCKDPEGIEVVKPSWSKASPNKILFEVKPTIESIGEVIRQIRRYECYVSAYAVVVSPDDRFSKLLKEQGIGFVKATMGQKDLF